jgi:uncharacterized protein
MADLSPRPVPAPDELTKPFWAATAEHRLEIQRCTACGHYNQPPKRLCDMCTSPDLGFVPVSGRGKVYSYTVMRQTSIAGFEDKVPYTTLLVELEEQPQLLLVSTVPGDGAGIAIGQRTELWWEPIDEGFVLPQFRPIA